MKEFLPTYRRKFKCSGKHGIKIKKGNRWNQKIFFVYSAEIESPVSLFFSSARPGPTPFQAAVQLLAYRSTFA